MRQISSKTFLLAAVLALGIVSSVAAQPNMPPASPSAPNPQVLIKRLPAALQPVYQRVLQVQISAGSAQMGSPQAPVQAELKALESIQEALLATRNYLPGASAAEKEAIAGALVIVPPRPPGQQPMPQPPAVKPGDVAQKVDRMLRDVEDAIKRLKSGGIPPGPMPGPGPRPRLSGPMPGPPPAGRPGMPKVPPPCSDALRASEQAPQATDVPCNGKQGNLLFRTIGSKPPFTQAAVILPPGRAAGGFAIEALTRNKVVWGIRVEGGPDVYHSSMGPSALAGLVITDTVPSPSGRYTIYMDTAQSDPAARITVRFVDYPK